MCMFCSFLFRGWSNEVVRGHPRIGRLMSVAGSRQVQVSFVKEQASLANIVGSSSCTRVGHSLVSFEHSHITTSVQNVPYVFVTSKAALGRACGVTRPVCPGPCLV